MSELDQTIEELEAEVLAELERAKRRINERVRKRQANEDTLEFLRFLKKL